MGFRAFARALGRVGPLAAAASVLPPLGAVVLLGSLPPLGDWLRTHEHIGILVFVSGFAVLGGFALLPTYTPSILGGWAFGLLPGWLATMAGFAGAATLGYVLSRQLAGDRVQTMLDSFPRSHVLRRALLSAHPVKVTAIAALLRLPPSSPFALTNLLLAASGIAFLPYVVGSLLGLAPRAAAAVMVGASLSGLDAQHPGRSATALSGAALTVGVVVALGWLAKREITRLEREAVQTYGNPDPTSKG